MLHAADLVAIAADHSFSPRNLVYRWFWIEQAKRSCTAQNLVDAMITLDDSGGQPRVCMDEASPAEDRRQKAGRLVVDRRAFIDTVHGYGEALSTLEPTSGIDARISANDCAYACLAERGRSHFRIPSMRVEDAMNHHEFPNAAEAYAEKHAIAIGLAMASRKAGSHGAHLLGAALVYEAFAAHYLQDGVAAGHIVSSHYGYGNMSVSAMHDSNNQVGLEVALPRELCRHARDFKPRVAFPWLERQCFLDDGSATVVRGDHALAMRLAQKDPNACPPVGRSLGTKRCAADVTSDLATMLTLWSLLEVVRAPASSAWLDRPGNERFLALIEYQAKTLLHGQPNEILASWASQKFDFNELGNTPGHTEPETLFQRMLREMTEDQSSYLTTSAPTQYEPLGAMSLWPSPLVPARMREVPGAWHLQLRQATYPATLWQRNVTVIDLVSALGIGTGWTASWAGKRVDLDVDAFATYGSFPISDAGRRFGGGLHGTINYQALSVWGWSFLLQGGAAVETIAREAVKPGDPSRTWQLTGFWTPISYEIATDHTALHIGVPIGVGFVGANGEDPVRGLVNVGLEVAALWRPERKVIPLSSGSP
jgi:hypothetical protein